MMEKHCLLAMFLDGGRIKKQWFPQQKSNLGNKVRFCIFLSGKQISFPQKDFPKPKTFPKLEKYYLPDKHEKLYRNNMRKPNLLHIGFSFLLKETLRPIVVLYKTILHVIPVCIPCRALAHWFVLNCIRHQF